MRRILIVGLLVVALGGCFVVIRWSAPADAAGQPCDTLNAGVSPQEQQLFDAVNSWRAGNLGQPPMQLSGPANRAAQWFAEAMIAGDTSGHTDQYGRQWAQRLIDCGWVLNISSGEALAGFGSSNQAYGSTPAEALAIMTDLTPGHQNGVQAPVPWECVGVGYWTNPSPAFGEFRYAWVVVTTGYKVTGCPEPGGGPPEPPTKTPTATRTPTPTATPTPTIPGPRVVAPYTVRSDE